MQVSVVNKDSDTVRRMWLWIVLSMYLILILSFGAFLGLYITTKEDKNDIENSLTGCDAETQELANKTRVLEEEIQRFDTENAEMATELKDLLNKNSQLEEILENNTKALNSAKAMLPYFKIPRDVCLVVGGISLLANLYVVPATIYYYRQAAPLEEKLGYFLPRYEIGVNHTIETLLAEALGKKVVLESVAEFNTVPTKAEFYDAINGKANTVTLLYTDQDEVIGFVLHPEWNKDTSEILDPLSYTISFRNSATATIKAGVVAVNMESEFLEIGRGEIVVKGDGKGTGQSNVGFVPDEHQNGNPGDFYVKNGQFILKSIKVYSWTLS